MSSRSPPAEPDGDTAWVEQSPLPLGVIRDGRFVHVNEALATLLALRREDLVGRPFYERVADEDQPRVRERNQRRLKGEPVPESYEFDVVRSDGATRHVELWASALAPGTIVFQLADRTHLVARRAKLLALAGLGAAIQREHTVERILTTLGDGLVALGIAWARMAPEESGLRLVDAGAPGQLLAQFEQASGATIRGHLGSWRTGGRKAWAEGAAFIDDIPLGAAIFWGDARVQTAARDVGIRRGLALRIDVKQHPWQLLMILGDWLLEDDLASFSLLRIQVSGALDAASVIADLSARNEQLAVLNQVGAVAGAATDLAEIFRTSTAALARVIGTDAFAVSLLDESGEHLELVYHLGFPDEAVEWIRRVSAIDPRVRITDLVRRRAPMMYRRSDLQLEYPGLTFDVMMGIPLIAGAKVLGMLVATYADGRAARTSHLELLQSVGAHFAAAIQAKRLLDDLRQSYADLARTQEQLVQRERLAALGELAAVVAHEIRNPLGVVFNAVGAIRQQAGVDPRLATLVGILEEEATRMNDIVGDLLDLARPVSPALRPERVEPIVLEAVDAALAEASAPIEVERDIADGLPAVPIDQRLLRQAILNVANNAVQALGDDGGKITVRVQRADGAVRIEIADSGPGIPPEVQRRIFEPFFTTRASGTGLGLTVVKRIVDVHRGETDLDSAEGRGTRFVIRLPVA